MLYSNNSKRLCLGFQKKWCAWSDFVLQQGWAHIMIDRIHTQENTLKCYSHLWQVVTILTPYLGHISRDTTSPWHSWSTARGSSRQAARKWYVYPVIPAPKIVAIQKMIFFQVRSSKTIEKYNWKSRWYQNWTFSRRNMTFHELIRLNPSVCSRYSLEGHKHRACAWSNKMQQAYILCIYI